MRRFCNVCLKEFMAASHLDPCPHCSDASVSQLVQEIIKLREAIIELTNKLSK